VSNLIVIGISGRKRHGKDTVGAYLRDVHGFRPIAFADPVKQIGMEIYGLTWQQCYGAEVEKEALIPRWGRSARQILQHIGTEMGRGVHPDTWARYTMDLIGRAARGEPYLVRSDAEQRFVSGEPYAGPWVITDVRFPNEADAVRSIGGPVWKVVRPSMGVSQDMHASETSVDLILEDGTLTNDGSLEDLYNKVQSLLRGQCPDLAWDEVRDLRFGVQ